MRKIRLAAVAASICVGLACSARADIVADSVGTWAVTCTTATQTRYALVDGRLMLSTYVGEKLLWQVTTKRIVRLPNDQVEIVGTYTNSGGVPTVGTTQHTIFQMIGTESKRTLFSQQTDPQGETKILVADGKHMQTNQVMPLIQRCR